MAQTEQPFQPVWNKSIGPQVRLVGHGWDCEGTWREVMEALWNGVVFHDLDVIESFLFGPSVPRL